MKFPRATLILSGVTALVLVAACGTSDGSAGGSAGGDFPAGSKMATLSEQGTIRVGTQTTYPLVGMRELDGYSGFDVEVAKLIAAKLGIDGDKVDFVPVTTPTRESFLQQDKVDMVIAAYTITDERDKVIDFAGPYIKTENALMVPAGNPLGITSLGDLEGKKLCTTSGGAQEVYVKENFPGVAKGLVLFDSSANCAEAVINGQVAASTTENAILASFVKQNGGKTEVVGEPYGASYWGIGVPQTEDKVFCEWVNETLEALYADGSWAKAYDDTVGTVLGAAPEPPAVGSCSTSGAE